PSLDNSAATIPPVHPTPMVTTSTLSNFSGNVIPPKYFNYFDILLMVLVLFSYNHHLLILLQYNSFVHLDILSFSILPYFYCLHMLDLNKHLLQYPQSIAQTINLNLLVEYLFHHFLLNLVFHFVFLLLYLKYFPHISYHLF